jgi:hypothetical protein
MMKAPLKIEWVWAMANKWTFEITFVYDLLQQYLKVATNVLVPFAGETRFSHKQCTYIDIEDGRPPPYIKGDSLEVLPTLVKDKKKYDLIISDPPFSMFQAVHTYGNKRLQDITYIKQNYVLLCRPGGRIIHFGFNSTGMGHNRGFLRERLIIMNFGGSHNDMEILIEKRIEGSLDSH